MSQFALSWVGMSLAGSFLGWLVVQGIHSALFSRVYQTAGLASWRISNLVLTSLTYGWSVGYFQAKVLADTVVGPRWREWPWTRVAGIAVSGLVWQWFFWDSKGVGGEFQRRILAGAISGIGGGLLAGILQARLLYKKLGAPRWIGGWSLLCAGATSMGGLAGAGAWQSIAGRQPSPSTYFAAGLGQMIVTGLVSSALMGLPLGRWLWKHPALGRPEPLEPERTIQP